MEERVRQSGAAGSKTFAGSNSRKYNYFDPQGRRASVYEDVTVDVQPDVSRYLIQGWLMTHADGLPTYHEGTTALKSSDWHVYRAPDQEWERTHFQRQGRIETSIKTIVDSARGSHTPQGFEPQWRTFLQDHVGAMKHAEFGLGVALMTAQRDGITQMINNTMLTNSSYKLRVSQDVTLYLGDIGMDIEIDADEGKKNWMENAVWQPTRKVVESILSTRDHLEVYFVINILFEALVGELIRAGLISRAAPAANDFVTPTVLAPALEDYQRNRANTVALFLMLANDAEHGQANKEIMSGWLSKHLPLCVDAAKGLQPLWAETGTLSGDDFDVAYKQATDRVYNMLVELEISMPDGVSV